MSMLQRARDYQFLYRDFRWSVPEFYNIGVDVCDRHAGRDGHLALIFIDESGATSRFTFDDVRRLANRFANVLRADGLKRGDRVAILLPQQPETAIAHIAAFKSGLISVPLFTLFGDDALEFRLANCAAKAVLTDSAGLATLERVMERLPNLKHVYHTGSGNRGSAVSFNEALERASDDFIPIGTSAHDPAIIIYTSGTTGNPKGALHAHRVLLGHLPGVELSHDFLPCPGDLIWTAADWAWIGGLFDVLLPAWHHGITVVAHRARKFDPELAMHLMGTHHVRNVFLPPTALKLMRRARVHQADVHLRTIASGGEPLGAELLDWARATFGVTVNEFYGQTECNMVVANDNSLFPGQPASMGKPVPGHDVKIVDGDGREVPRGDVGTIGVTRADPAMFLGYWNDPEATDRKYASDVLLTGDLARQDDEGYIRFVGRSDDLITSAGYRIGPTEVEDCLLKHPAVAMAAVVGAPDPVRTEIVKAWVVLNGSEAPSEGLLRDIQKFVRERLAAHEYPREIVFTESLPTTATGKVIRRMLRDRSAV